MDGACVNALVDMCSDGTLEGSCSSDKPKYCDGGLLGDYCELCGCPFGYECGTDQTCSVSSSEEDSTPEGTEEDAGRNDSEEDLKILQTFVDFGYQLDVSKKSHGGHTVWEPDAKTYSDTEEWFKDLLKQRRKEYNREQEAKK